MKPDGENQAYQLSIVAVNQTTDSQFGEQSNHMARERPDWARVVIGMPALVNDRGDR